MMGTFNCWKLFTQEDYIFNFTSWLGECFTIRIKIDVASEIISLSVESGIAHAFILNYLGVKDPKTIESECMTSTNFASFLFKASGDVDKKPGPAGSKPVILQKHYCTKSSLNLSFYYRIMNSPWYIPIKISSQMGRYVSTQTMPNHMYFIQWNIHFYHKFIQYLG